MVDRLRVFADEVTRVAKEVGTEGKLGGQAEVPGVAGTWKGAHRQRERDGELAHRAGAHHRRRGHRGDEGRPDAADHRRGAGRAGRAQAQHQPDDREPEGDDGAQPGAGLAEDEPGEVQPDDAGAEGPRARVAPHHERADAAGVGAPRRVLHHGQRRGRRRCCALIASYAYRARKHVGNRFAHRRGARRAGGAGEEADPAHERPGRLHPDHVRARRGAAAQHHRPPDPVRGRGEGGDRARELPAVQPDPPDLPRPARRVDRRRAEHDQREHAHRGAARAVAEAHAGAAEPVARSCSSSRTSSSARTRSWRRRRRRCAQSEELLKEQQEELQQVNEELEEKASLLAEQNQKVEQKNREVEARAARARGEGRAARAQLASTRASSWRT